MGLEKASLEVGKEVIVQAKNGKRVLEAAKSAKIDTAGLRLAPQLESDVVEVPQKKGFCHEFWDSIVNEKAQCTLSNGEPVSLGTPTQVNYHYYLHSFNGMLNNNSPINFNRPLKPVCFNEAYPTVADAISVSDYGFKTLTPLKENLTVYRCIPKRPPFFKQENAIFEKAINLKPGETIAMREYAYCTPDIKYSQQFLNEEGLMYEISLPKGARISQGYFDGYRDYILPRYSRFRCISNETLEDGTHKIKLEYILPDDSWRK